LGQQAGSNKVSAEIAKLRNTRWVKP
jgi:hypothetical protein